MLGSEQFCGSVVAAGTIGFPRGVHSGISLPGRGVMSVDFTLAIAGALTRDALAPLALWWSAGSGRVGPTILTTRGLPICSDDLFSNLTDEVLAAADERPSA